MSRCYDEQFVQDNSDVCSSVYAVQEAVERLIEVVKASKPARQQDRFIQFPTAIFREQQFSHCTIEIGDQLSIPPTFLVEVVLTTNEKKVIFFGLLHDCDNFVAKAKILGTEEAYEAMCKHNDKINEGQNEAK
jgi:hypothetical protein